MNKNYINFFKNFIIFVGKYFTLTKKHPSGQLKMNPENNFF